MGLTTSIRHSGIDPILGSTMEWLQGQNLLKEKKLDEERLSKVYAETVEVFKNLPEDATTSDINEALYGVLGKAGKYMDKIFPLASAFRLGEIVENKERKDEATNEKFADILEGQLGGMDISGLTPDMMKTAYDGFKPQEKNVDIGLKSYSVTKPWDAKQNKYVIDPTQTIETGLSREGEIRLTEELALKRQAIDHWQNMREIQERGFYDILKDNSKNGGKGSGSEEDLLKQAKLLEEYHSNLKIQKEKAEKIIDLSRTSLRTMVGAYTEKKGLGGTVTKEYNEGLYKEKVKELRNLKKKNAALWSNEDQEKISLLNTIDSEREEVDRITLKENILNPRSSFYNFDVRDIGNGKTFVSHPHIEERTKDGSVNEDWEKAWNQIYDSESKNPQSLFVQNGKIVDPKIFREAVLMYLIDEAKENPLRFETEYGKVLK
jgi:hypothetical protein